ncbi:MAG: hypothetical protein H0V37_08610 [Chloroflexia bacterium]|nr:hypothetical protein [Chloroflexia bacterium]
MGCENEQSPYNIAAVKSVSSIWNEDTIPVVPWEEPTQRKVLPKHVQEYIGAIDPIIRVPKEIHTKEIGKHASSLRMYDNLELFLDAWTHRGFSDHGNGDHRWRFVASTTTSSGTMSPYIIVIAKRQDGSHVLVSGHYRTQSYIRRLVLQGDLEMRGEV